MEIIEFRAMGCKMLAAIDGEEEKVRPLLEQVPEWFERWEQALSRFRADSELSRLNSEGYLAGASPTLVQVMTASLNAARQSGGLVNPGMLAAVEAAGYDRTFDILDPDSAPALSPTPFLSFSFVQPRPDDWQKIEIQGRAVRLGTDACGSRRDCQGLGSRQSRSQAEQIGPGSCRRGRGYRHQRLSCRWFSLARRHRGPPQPGEPTRPAGPCRGRSSNFRARLPPVAEGRRVAAPHH